MSKKKWYLVSAASAALAVSTAAAHGGAGHFQKMDKNADGVLTTAEFESSLLERFTESDANDDGKVTADELKARFEAHKQERFQKRDANGNGQLERAEVERMPDELFARADADKSGALSKDELQAMKKGHRKHFMGKKLPGDADGDGVVTKSEAVTGAAAFAKRLDANADGQLTKDELKPHGRGGRHGRGHGPDHHDEG